MRYRTASAFRTALEQRLLARSRSTGLALPRLRKLVAFERLLARLIHVAPDRWILKGGLALEFRLSGRARSTVDMDLARQDDEDAAAVDFAAAQRAELDDYFTFDIVRTKVFEDADVAGAIRYRGRADLAGRQFDSFVVDVGFSDPPVARPDEVSGTDLLAFADLAPLRVPTLPLPMHVAEKVHAYTRRYRQQAYPSTRVKDLVDLALLSSTSGFVAGDLQVVLRRVFDARATHSVPISLPAPPLIWEASYRSLAHGLLVPSDLDEGFRHAAALLDPVLGRLVDDDARWDPERRAWTD